MKKLLVLTLVLGMASLAPAWLVAVDATDVAVGETITMTITATANDLEYSAIYGGVVETEADNAILSYSGWALGASAPDLAQAAAEYDWTLDGFEGADLVSDSTTATFVEGQYFLVTFGADAAGVGNLYFYDYGTQQYDEFAINVVPEPATMALLGLGGLLSLRRRK